MAFFRGDRWYGAQVDMCHLGSVRNGIPKPSKFRCTKVAAAIFKTALQSLPARRKEHNEIRSSSVYPRLAPPPPSPLM